MQSSKFSGVVLSLPEQLHLIKKLEIFKIQGTDRSGRPILLIVGKLVPARLVSADALNKFLKDEIFPSLEGCGPYTVVYLHSRVNRRDNSLGIRALKSVYEAVPAKVRDDMVRFYFVHPGLMSRVLVASLGRVFFPGFYGKVEYVSRVDLLWSKVRRKEVEIPEFVYEYDEELEKRPMMMVIGYYGVESENPRRFHDSSTCVVNTTYSTRSCIA